MKPESLTQDPEARAAIAWCHDARFLITAARLDQLPDYGLQEFAFVGRSNAGKSTAINTLAQQRRLAFASRTPGRTQHINLFALGPRDTPDTLWADLPGYGYAAVEKGAKLRWQRVMADYLAEREALTGIVLMIDSRLGFTPLDHRLLEFIAPRVDSGAVRLLVLLTKSDKLPRLAAKKVLTETSDALAGIASDQADVGVALFSALARTGVTDAALYLHRWALNPPAAAADGIPAVPTPEAPGTQDRIDFAAADTEPAPAAEAPGLAPAE
jgi:GTP-binding protein